jgi:hypothetical protein
MSSMNALAIAIVANILVGLAAGHAWQAPRIDPLLN